MITGRRTHWLGPATESQVESLERILGHPVHPDHRLFLLTHGSGLVDGVELLGLGKVEGQLPDVRFCLATLDELGFTRPRGVVPFSAAGNGDYAVVLADDIGGLSAGTVAWWVPRRDDAVDLQGTGMGLVMWVESQRR